MFTEKYNMTIAPYKCGTIWPKAHCLPDHIVMSTTPSCGRYVRLLDIFVWQKLT